MPQHCVGKAHEAFFRFEKGAHVAGGLFEQSGEHGLEIIVDRYLAEVVDEPAMKASSGL